MSDLSTAVDQMCERAGSVSWAELDERTRDAAVRALLDALAVAAAGTVAPGVEGTLIALARLSTGDVAVPWTTVRLPAPAAALALSLLIHAWDFDDTHDAAVVHACTVAVPAAYVAASVTGAAGSRFMEGVVAGVDVLCRMSQILGPQRGVIRTAGLASIGAAAAAGRVLGLGLRELRAAVALAAPLALAPTSRQAVDSGAISKRHQPGFGVSQGVVAAFMAGGGIGGAAGWFSGTYGLQAHVAEAKQAEEVLTSPGWEISRLSLKPYPTCRYTHAAIAGTLKLRTETEPSRVKSALIQVPKGASHVVVARPWERRGHAVTDAQFSIPWLVAAALELGTIDLDVLRGPALLSPVIEARAGTVSVVTDQDPGPGGMTPARITLIDDASRTAEITVPLGSPVNPLNATQVSTKIRSCLSAAGLPEALAATLESTIRQLPESAALPVFDAALRDR